jgi:hypothetical protein
MNAKQRRKVLRLAQARERQWDIENPCPHCGQPGKHWLQSSTSRMTQFLPQHKAIGDGVWSCAGEIGTPPEPSVGLPDLGPQIDFNARVVFDVELAKITPAMLKQATAALSVPFGGVVSPNPLVPGAYDFCSEEDV